MDDEKVVAHSKGGLQFPKILIQGKIRDIPKKERHQEKGVKFQMHLNESPTSSLLKERPFILIYIVFYFRHSYFLFSSRLVILFWIFLFTLTWHYLNMLTNSIFTKC